MSQINRAAPAQFEDFILSQTNFMRKARHRPVSAADGMSGLLAAGQGPLGAGVRDASGPAAEGAQARRDHNGRGGQRLHPGGLLASPKRAYRGSAGRARIGLHAHSRRRPRSPRARCGRISSRRGSRRISTPTARTPSSTGQDASAARTRKERSGRETNAAQIRSAARLWDCGQGVRLAHSPTGRTKAEEADI